MKRFHFIEVFFHIFYYYWGKENILLYQGLCYIEVHYNIKVPLYQFNLFIVLNTGKDGRDGRDGSGIKVGLFKLQTLLSVFA